MKYLKFKDLFTTLNLFLTFYSIVLVFSGQFKLASYLLFITIVVLDLLDGLVARITKTHNEFGKHFDSITDFVGSSMTVPFFIYFAFRDYNIYVALSLGFLPLFVGVLRDIMAKLEGIKATTYFVGMPRNIATITIVAYLNSTFFVVWDLYIVGILFIILICYFQVSHIPFLGNDKRELNFIPRIKIYLVICVVLQIVCTFTGAFWDGVTLFLVANLLAPFVLIDKEVWATIKNQVTALKST